MGSSFKIAVIPGDGIGPEVIREGIKVLNLIEKLDDGISFSYRFFPWNCDYYHEHGSMMPEDGIEQLSHYDAILLGAIGHPSVPDHISLWELVLKIRKAFDQYINLRPVKLLQGAPCPLVGMTCSDIDMIYIRENSEGEYAGEGAWLFPGTPEETVLQHAVFSRKGCSRVMRYAFELARAKNKSLTSVSKGNALNYSMVFWDSMFNEISKEYPDVPTHSYLVDAASMFMVRDPKRFEVVVTSNLFGDILTDLGAAITGGMGLSAGANINPERKYPSMFEAIHGSAPDIAGKNIANPLATIWAIGQMMEFFNLDSWSDIIIKAIEDVLVSKKTLTPDIGGNSTTEEVGDEVIASIEKLCESKNLSR